MVLFKLTPKVIKLKSVPSMDPQYPYPRIAKATFAIFPTRMTDGTVIWFEEFYRIYRWKWTYEQRMGYASGFMWDVDWKPECRCTVSQLYEREPYLLQLKVGS